MARPGQTASRFESDRALLQQSPTGYGSTKTHLVIGPRSSVSRVAVRKSVGYGIDIDSKRNRLETLDTLLLGRHEFRTHT